MLGLQNVIILPQSKTMLFITILFDLHYIYKNVIQIFQTKNNFARHVCWILTLYTRKALTFNTYTFIHTPLKTFEDKYVNSTLTHSHQCRLSRAIVVFQFQFSLNTSSSNFLWTLPFPQKFLKWWDICDNKINLREKIFFKLHI